MEKDVEVINNIISNSQSAALLLDKNSLEETFLVKEALKTALSQKGLALISLPQEDSQYVQKWSALLSSNNLPVPQKVSIHIPKDKYPIKELQYDENDKFFSLLIITQGKSFDKEGLVFEQALPKVDVAFCFFKDPEVLNKFRTSLELPSEENIIFIKPRSKTLSEEVFNIISAFNLETETVKTSHLSTLLLAAIIKETGNFTKDASKELFQTTASLIEQGANQKTIEEILDKEKSASFWQLLGRGLARTTIDPASESSWTFLTKKDFEKTKLKAEPPLLSWVLKELGKSIPNQSFSLLLWQTPHQGLPPGVRHTPSQTTNSNDEVWAIINSSDEQKLLLLANNFGANPQNLHLKIGPFNNFSEAEIQIRRILKTVLL